MGTAWSSCQRQLRRAGREVSPMARKKDDPTQVLLKALRHPLRRQLLRCYLEARKPISPKELATSMKQPLSNVSYHVRELAKFGVVEIAEEEQVRGSVQHFYEATALARDTPWALVTLGLKPEQRGSKTQHARPNR